MHEYIICCYQIYIIKTRRKAILSNWVNEINGIKLEKCRRFKNNKNAIPESGIVAV